MYDYMDEVNEMFEQITNQLAAMVVDGKCLPGLKIFNDLCDCVAADERFADYQRQEIELALVDIPMDFPNELDEEQVRKLSSLICAMMMNFIELACQSGLSERTALLLLARNTKLTLS